MSTDDDLDPFDILAEEFADRCRRGEMPSIAEYEARYPAHAERIRKLLPTVAMMETLKRGTRGGHSLGSSRTAPDRFGEFRVLREIGRGGMGIVYEAVQESLGRHVALKVVHHPHLDLKRLPRFQREARAVAGLHHTNIVPIYAIGEHDGLPFYAMQCIQGEGLDALINCWKRGKPPLPEEHARLVATLGSQAADALQHAHEQGVLHRDIKPANLLLDEQGTAWITDFGLAKLVGQDDLTATGDVIGTLRYLAPEALRGEYSSKSDVYSLGLTLYELVTLEAPFGDLSPSQLLRELSERGPTRPRKLDPNIPSDLETIILKATAREPEERYETAGQLADDLLRFLEDRPIRARRVTFWEQAWRWSRRNKGTSTLIVTAAASLMLAAIVGWAGYGIATKALERESLRRREAEIATKRADDNVQLSLQVFGELFEKLTARDDGILPPLKDLAKRKSGGPEKPGVGRPGGPRPGNAEDDTALLQSVLDFYETFAQKNSSNPKLEGEAAWAYHKVAMLYQRLRRWNDSDKASTRSIAMFEKLNVQFPDDARIRGRLIEAYIQDNLIETDPGTLAIKESQLVRALELLEQSRAENDKDLQTRIQIQSRLGMIRHQAGKLNDAETSYRAALDLSQAEIERSPRNHRARSELAGLRDMFATLLIDRGREPEARTLLDATANDLETLGRTDGGPIPLAERFASLANSYRRIRDINRAQKFDRRAEEMATRGAQSPPGPPPGRQGGRGRSEDRRF